MIERVGGQNTYNAAYERSGKKAARIEGDAPAFLLPEDENGGVVWERSTKKEAAKPSLRVKSDEYVPAAANKEKEPEAAEAAAERSTRPGILERIRETLKSFISRIWYGDEQEGEKKAPVAKREESAAASRSAPADRSERISRLISASDSEGLYEELTEGGKRPPARNTSLLTYYDRFGRIVKPGDSDTGRILRGERTNERRNIVMRPQGNYRRYV